MYKILFVDDEKIIREKTLKLLDWNELGFEIVASLESGEAAIEFLKFNKVDMVITDIKMGAVSGIDLSKFIYENKIGAKVVILSGYNDFEYARQAIKYGVNIYLLKPITATELKESLIEIKKVLEPLNKTTDVKLCCFYNWINEIQAFKKQDWDKLTKKMYKFDLNISIENTKIYEFEYKINGLDYYLKNNWDYGKESLTNAINTCLRDIVPDGYIYCLGIVKTVFKIIVLDAWDTKSIIFDRLDNHIQESLSSILHLELKLQKYNLYKNIKYWCAIFNTTIDNKFEDKEIISKIKEIVNVNYNGDLSLSELAANFFVSPPYLSKVFKAETGLSFIEYMQNVRLTNAKKLLSNPDLSVYEVCEKIGYNDLKHFRIVFRNVFGVTPAEFRKKILNKNAD